MAPRKVALCMASYKGSDVPVMRGLIRMAFALGRRTDDEFSPFIASRQRAEVAANRSLALMEAAERNHDVRFTHVLWMDDDIVVEPDAIIRLLDLVDNSHPVVAALAFDRNPPYAPAIWKKVHQWGNAYHSLTQILDYPQDDWVPIIASGLCCVAFDREVFEAIKKPYFDWIQEGYDRNDHTPDGHLFGQFEDHHIPCFCHTGVKVGHMSHPVIVDEAYAKSHGDWEAGLGEADEEALE